MIRLLKKEEIDRKKNEERQQEVSEGLKISRRVDSLRELQAKEEENLDKFRKESVAKISKEINDLENKKEATLKEVNELEIKLSKMLPDVPIKRKELADLSKKLDDKEKEILERERKANLLEIDIAVALKDSEDSLLRNLTQEEESKKLHSKAEEERKEAKSILEKAKQIESIADKLKKDTEISILLKESALEEKEKGILMKEQDNIAKQKELENEKIQLADQRATLERALLRIKNNRL